MPVDVEVNKRISIIAIRLGHIVFTGKRYLDGVSKTLEKYDMVKAEKKIDNRLHYYGVVPHGRTTLQELAATNE